MSRILWRRHGAHEGEKEEQNEGKISHFYRRLTKIGKAIKASDVSV